ncbi:hypothetical protein Srubr_40060 [Streptomyces rubradiris]|uniref:Uncharacterized protein n=1 Tax=Streptomyces rubradiris TaxID=285531 RepID=A0ABQ3RE76_STRRR|nr:hypothetical protein Srubr_40060 [Streptomyces rubradiris]
MRVLPLAAPSAPDPQAVAARAREEQTPIATTVRRNPVCLIGGPLMTLVAGAVGAAHSSTADIRSQETAQNL